MRKEAIIIETFIVFISPTRPLVVTKLTILSPFEAYTVNASRPLFATKICPEIQSLKTEGDDHDGHNEQEEHNDDFPISSLRGAEESHSE